jgi:copper transport protein
MIRRFAATVALVVVGLGLTSPGAGAHALLTASQPAANAQLDQPPAAVVLTFTETPDPALAAVHVIDSGGHTVEKGKPSAVPGQPTSLTVALGKLDKGSYTVTWRTTSIVDGHTTGGSFAFGVGVKPTAAPTVRVPRTPRPSGLGVAGRWALYMGLALLVGAALLRALGYDASTRRLAAAWLLAALGATAMAADFLRVTHAGVGRLAHTGAGRKVGYELAAVAIVGVALALLSLRRRRWSWVVLAGAAAVAMLARVWAGHAAASSIPWLTTATQWTHVLTIGLWVGGLPWLIAAVRSTDGPARGRLARRLSTVAGLALAVTIATGTARAVSEVGSWRGLFHTSFGRALLVKLALVVALVAVGARNRYRHVSRAGDAAQPLLRGLRVEIAVATVLLGATAVLTGLAPASSVAASKRAPTGVMTSGHDFGTTMRVRLSATPGLVGLNHFSARVTDYDSGRVLSASRVTLRFALPARSDIPAASVPLTRTGAEWTGDSAVLAISGSWDVHAIVETGLGGTDVPLTLKTRQLPARITAQRAAGVPTLYTITSGSRQVQAYVDPGRPGFNEVHFTFLDPSGAEVPTDLIAARARRAGSQGPGTALEFRRLDAGHFVADATLTRGEWRFSFVTADGFAASFRQRV